MDGGLMEGAADWAADPGLLEWISSLNGLGVLASVLSLLLSIGSILFARRALRIVCNRNHVLQHLAKAHANLSRHLSVSSKAIKKAGRRSSNPGDDLRQQNLRDALGSLTRVIEQFVNNVLDLDCFAYLVIGRFLQRRGEVGVAVWFLQEAEKQNQVQRCLSLPQSISCLEDLEDCQIALGRIREALETRDRRLALRNRRGQGPAPGWAWEHRGLARVSMYLSMPFKFGKYMFLGMVSLAFGSGTLLVMYRP